MFYPKNVKKAHRKSPTQLMRRTSRVYLNDLNAGKTMQIKAFLHLCRDATQYFMDLFWQRRDFSANLADLSTIHRGRDRFQLTTRLAQALAKQAKEMVRAAVQSGQYKKPNQRRWTTTLYYHFVTIEQFSGNYFDYALHLIGSGAPRLTLPVHSTSHLNTLLANDWKLSRTIRLGYQKGRVYVDFLLEKPRPAHKAHGTVVGMDSNIRNGLVFSDEQVVAQHLAERVRSFKKRQKNTYAEVKSIIGQELKHLDYSNIRLLSIEDLKRVKEGKSETFSRLNNRRLSHWLYAYIAELLARQCEEQGVRLERKHPWKTSQYCRFCDKWDRRNRSSDRFRCVHCGYCDQADHNAALNLALLGEAGVYGLRSLQSLSSRQP